MNILVFTHSALADLRFVTILKNFQITQQRARFEHFMVPFLHVWEVK